MAVTSQSLEHTPIPGHSFPSGNKKRQFTKWADAREPFEYPWTDYVGIEDGRFEQIEFEGGQSFNLPVTTAIKTLTTNSSASVDVDATTYLQVGDVLKITQYYSGSSTELDYSTEEVAPILSITDSDTVVLKRHSAALTSGNWSAHPVGSLVEVIGRAQNYNGTFTDGITQRGDIITNYVGRIDHGELTWDISYMSKFAPTYESSDQMLDDKVKARKKALKYREQMLIRGIKMAGNYTANPQEPYISGGAIWWMQQRSDNLFDIDGNILSIFDFDDALRLKWEAHDKGPGLDFWCGPLTFACMQSMLLPFKEGRLADTTITNKLTGMSLGFGDIKVKYAREWPEGKVALLDKSIFKGGTATGQNWREIKRTPEELGQYSVSWNMVGDFGLDNEDSQRPILFYDVDTRIDGYPGRNIGF